jgi:hypothetical protein
VPAGLDALAFQTRGQWAVIVINQNAAGSAPATVSLRLPGGSRLRPEGTYQTSATASMARVANPPVRGSTATLTTPAQSVTTFLIR